MPRRNNRLAKMDPRERQFFRELQRSEDPPPPRPVKKRKKTNNER